MNYAPLNKALAFATGFGSFIVQIVLLREFMNLFSGNELVIGLMLALWMSATAFGAWAGRFIRKTLAGGWETALFILLQGLAPLAGIFLAVWLRRIMFAPGEMVDLQGVILICLSGVMTFCVISGMIFNLLATALADAKGTSGISTIYAIEAAGSLAGGVIYNFLLIDTLEPLKLLCFIAIANGFIAIWFAFGMKRTRTALGSLIFTSAMIVLVNLYDADRLMASYQHPGQRILLTGDSPYGRYTLTEEGDQHVLFMFGEACMSSDDPIRREEKVHYPMALHPFPDKVLMIFDGLDGSSAEAAKYKPRVMVYADPGYPWIKAAIAAVDTGFFPSGDVITTDPRHYLGQTQQSFDVVIINAAPPNTIGGNRFYTREFFSLVRQRMNDHGIVSVRLPGSGNYLDRDIRAMYSSIYNTLKTRFKHIRIIPGEQTFFLASDHPIIGDITRKIKEKDIPTLYVNEWYLDDRLLESRAGIIIQQLDPEADINRDQRPLAAYLGISRWAGMFHFPKWMILALPLLVMAIIIFFLRPVNTALFVTGFTSSSAEFILLISFQLAYGFVYQMAGYVIMFFMLGLATGAGYLHRIVKAGKNSYLVLQGTIGLFMLILPLTVNNLSAENITYWLPGALICTLTFTLAVIAGIQYRIATFLVGGSGRRTASSTYGADLAGSAIGIFLTAAVIYPLAGSVLACLLLASMNFLTLAYLKWRMN